MSSESGKRMIHSYPTFNEAQSGRPTHYPGDLIFVESTGNLYIIVQPNGWVRLLFASEVP